MGNTEHLVMLLDEKQTADRLGCAVQSLRNRRFLRKPPNYVKLGRSVRYDVRDIAEFVERHKVRTDD